MRFDSQTAERIGLNWLRAAIAPTGDFGRRAEDAAHLFGPGDEAAAQGRCRQIVDLAARLEPDRVAHIRAALRRAPDVLDIVSRATVGDPLTDVDFFEVGRFLDALEGTARTWDAAGGPAASRPALLSELAALLAPGRSGGQFYLADAFGAELAATRQAAVAAEDAVTRERERLRSAIAPLLDSLPERDEFIVMRDVQPQLPAGVRVVRETPAYRVLALELDAAALAAIAARDAILAAVAAAEEHCRRCLATEVAQHGAALLSAATELGELDRTLARVAFTLQWGGCVPSVGSGRVAFTRASFVPLRSALAEVNRAYTPLSLQLTGVAVITGPNMGGKSAALATCGFLAACFALGVPPPAQAAELPLFATVAWVGGEAGTDRARLLSAFGAEVVRARDALGSAASPALLLVDEFARTTGPREGRALLVAFVEELERRGVFAVVATHFDGVARSGHVAHLRITGLAGRALAAGAAPDIDAALDAVAAAMDYQVVVADEDTDRHSDALALAGLLGLDARIVRRAAELFGPSAAGQAPAMTE